jgi:AraC-like DNA-binding protein
MPLSRRDFSNAVRVIGPGPALASCVRMYVTRSTLGRPQLPPAQRRNHYPAIVYCTLIWFIEGSARVVDSATGDIARKLPSALFCGPQTRPFGSYNPGPAQVFAVVFFPDAMHALTGIEISQHVNRVAALETVLGGVWLELSRDVMAATDDAARIAVVERFLAPLWREAFAHGAVRDGAFRNWATAFAAYAAAAGWGRSARNLERRIKTWGGQPLRTLRRLSRLECALLEVRQAWPAGSVSWADLAARRGFADQAHLCREMRAMTGHSPTELVCNVAQEEGYWLYRALS